MARHFMWILLAAESLLWGVGPCWARDGNPMAIKAASCKAVSEWNFTDIEDAPTHISSADFIEPKDGEPGHCRVRGYIWPQVGFELQLPETWNGRFIEMGSGGEGGNLDWATNCPTHRGYACIATDMGHTGRGGLWAYNNLQAMVDYGYRAAHVAAVAGKVITGRYYGRPPKHSYFHGCSTGARQALVQAQRFPWDFDGIIAGGVWIDETISTMTLVWGSRVLKDETGKPLLSEEDFQAVRQAVLQQCDLDDGLKDGLIGNPLRCQFDPAVLQCQGEKKAGCLTDRQIQAVKKVYEGPTTSTGIKLSAGGSVPGTEHGWKDYIGSLEQWPKSFFRGMVIPPAGFQWNLRDFDFDRDYKRFLNGAQESLVSNNNPDLRTFKGAGGKLMLYVGWNEWSLPKRAIDYYDTVERTMGGPANTQDFFRLFMIPGADHCTGGEGPFAVDFLTYMEAWVERDQAPDMMIGAHVSEANPWTLRYPLPPETAVSFTRPLYPYPLWAKYRGTGDPSKAENFKAVGQ